MIFLNLKIPTPLVAEHKAGHVEAGSVTHKFILRCVLKSLRLRLICWICRNCGKKKLDEESSEVGGGLQSSMFLIICKKFVFFKQRKLRALMPLFILRTINLALISCKQEKDQYEILWWLSVLGTITIRNYWEVKQAMEAFSVVLFKNQLNKNSYPKTLTKKELET